MTTNTLPVASESTSLLGGGGEKGSGHQGDHHHHHHYQCNHHTNYQHQHQQQQQQQQQQYDNNINTNGNIIVNGNDKDNNDDDENPESGTGDRYETRCNTFVRFVFFWRNILTSFGVGHFKLFSKCFIIPHISSTQNIIFGYDYYSQNNWYVRKYCYCGQFLGGTSDITITIPIPTIGDHTNHCLFNLY